MSDYHTHTFTWAGHGDNVVVTGSFDDWKSTLTLTRGADGKLSALLPVKYGEKITFKYVVDGQWQHNPDEPHETDGSGNVNNVFTAPEAPAVVPTESSQPTAEVAAMPVPASVATTDATVPSTEEIQKAVAKEQEQVAAPSSATDDAEANKPHGVLETAAAGVAAALTGVGALAGAALTAASGTSSPLTLVSSHDEEKKTPEPTPTPAPIAPTTSAATVSSAPAPAAIDQALEQKQDEQKPVAAKVQDYAAPVLGAAAAGAATLGAGAVAAGQKTAESASSFGASTMKALGLDDNVSATNKTTTAVGANEPTPKSVTTAQPVVPAAAIAPVIPLDDKKTSTDSAPAAKPSPAATTSSSNAPAPQSVTASQPTVPAAAIAQPPASSSVASTTTTASPVSAAPATAQPGTPPVSSVQHPVAATPAASAPSSSPAAAAVAPPIPAKESPSPTLNSGHKKKGGEGLGVAGGEGAASGAGAGASHPTSSGQNAGAGGKKTERKPSLFHRLFKSKK